MTRFRSAKDLQAHLEHVSKLPDACKQVIQGLSECDPWKYEGTLLNELHDHREKGREKQADNIRELIWIGSVQTYERKDEKKILREIDEIRFLAMHAKPTKQRAEEALPNVRRKQEEKWKEKLGYAYHHPLESYETKAKAASANEMLEKIAEDLRDNVLGSKLEASVRFVEDLQLKAWLKLQQFVASHGVSLEELREEQNPHALALLQEVEDLRHVRDFLYYRRLHPDWARLALQSDKRETKDEKDKKAA